MTPKHKLVGWLLIIIACGSIYLGGGLYEFMYPAMLLFFLITSMAGFYYIFGKWATLLPPVIFLSATLSDFWVITQTYHNQSEIEYFQAVYDRHLANSGKVLGYNDLDTCMRMDCLILPGKNTAVFLQESDGLFLSTYDVEVPASYEVHPYSDWYYITHEPNLSQIQCRNDYTNGVSAENRSNFLHVGDGPCKRFQLLSPEEKINIINVSFEQIRFNKYCPSICEILKLEVMINGHVSHTLKKYNQVKLVMPFNVSVYRMLNNLKSSILELGSLSM